MAKIFDRWGQEYVLDIFCDDDTALTVYLYHKGNEIGHIFCNFEPEEMKIGDLIIWDNVIIGQRGCFYSILSLFGWKPNTTNYRNRRLGSILLDFVIEKALERGIKRISGVVVPQDHKNSPFLLNWYQKHGFQVFCLNGAKGKDRYLIHLEIADEEIKSNKV
jgi:hypothetical protein